METSGDVIKILGIMELPQAATLPAAVTKVDIKLARLLRIQSTVA